MGNPLTIIKNTELYLNQFSTKKPSILKTWNKSADLKKLMISPELVREKITEPLSGITKEEIGKLPPLEKKEAGKRLKSVKTLMKSFLEAKEISTKERDEFQKHFNDLCQATRPAEVKKEVVLLEQIQEWKNDLEKAQSSRVTTSQQLRKLEQAGKNIQQQLPDTSTMQDKRSKKEANAKLQFIQAQQVLDTIKENHDSKRQAVLHLFQFLKNETQKSLHSFTDIKDGTLKAKLPRLESIKKMLEEFREADSPEIQKAIEQCDDFIAKIDFTDVALADLHQPRHIKYLADEMPALEISKEQAAENQKVIGETRIPPKVLTFSEEFLDKIVDRNIYPQLEAKERTKNFAQLRDEAIALCRSANSRLNDQDIEKFILRSLMEKFISRNWPQGEEATRKDRLGMMAKVELAFEFTGTDKAELQRLALNEYLYQASLGLYVVHRARSYKQYSINSHEFGLLKKGLERALPKDFPHLKLTPTDVKNLAQIALEQTNERRQQIAEIARGSDEAAARLFIIEQEQTHPNSVKIRPNGLRSLIKQDKQVFYAFEKGTNHLLIYGAMSEQRAQMLHELHLKEKREKEGS